MSHTMETLEDNNSITKSIILEINTNKNCNNWSISPVLNSGQGVHNLTSIQYNKEDTLSSIKIEDKVCDISLQNSKSSETFSEPLSADMNISKVKEFISRSFSQSQQNFCRICLEGTSAFNDSLISPCKCTGTLAQIHQKCLEHWLSTSNTEKCEICNFPYDLIRVPPTYTEFLLYPDNRIPRRNLLADFICFLLLTPLLLLSVSLCYIGSSHLFFKVPWESTGLVILSVFLLFVYITWCRITLRYHTSCWNEWKSSHHKITLESLANNSTSCSIKITSVYE